MADRIISWFVVYGGTGLVIAGIWVVVRGLGL
jgi:succinate-acetate transporter protein